MIKDLLGYIKKFENGDPLTVWELGVLRAHFATLERALSIMVEPEYREAWKLSYEKLKKLEVMKPNEPPLHPCA